MTQSPKPSISTRIRNAGPLGRIGLVVAGLIVVGVVLSLSKGVTPATQPAAVPNVPWADYASDLQPRIDALARSKDCRGLQSEFDVADGASAATMTRTGHNNAQLMDYIDYQLRAAGCYSP